MGVVREKTEFIIGKGITDKVSARENGSTKCRKKKTKGGGRILFWVVFISSLT
jgi:hypothetical protein